MDPSLASLPVCQSHNLNIQMKSTPVASLCKYHEVVTALKPLTKIRSVKDARHFTLSALLSFILVISQAVVSVRGLTTSSIIYKM